MKRHIIISLFLLVASVISATAKDFVLVIDAGHGGKDAGAPGKYSNEKDINLKVALAFGRYVEKNCPDVKVIYTRKRDVFLELFERADIANKNHADVFVSIHTNAMANNHTSRGVETYSMTLRRSEEKLSAAQRENAVITYEKDYEQKYSGYDNASEETIIMYEVMHEINMKMSVDLAKSIQNNICSTASRPSKGVKQDNFHVLRRTSMPACLVEVGFISTPDEEAYLNNQDNIERTALGIYKGFIEYKTHNYNQTEIYTPDATQKPQQPKDDVAMVAPPAEEPKASHKRHESVEQRRMDTPANSALVEEHKAQQTKSTERETPKAQSVKQEEPKQQNIKQDGSKQQTARQEEPKFVAKEEAKSQDPDKIEGPVYKVQFLTAPRILNDGARELKGLTGVSHYKDGNIYKFTVGEASTLSEASRLKKEIADKFPDAFVVAFLDGQRIDLTQARQWKKK